jgi:hypothetical protein
MCVLPKDVCVREGGGIQELGQEDAHVCSFFIYHTFATSIALGKVKQSIKTGKK